MDTIHTLLFVLQILVAVVLIGFILIQHGKGADAGAAFGSGSSSTVFGSQGSGSFLTKVTTVLAIIFLGNSLFLAYLASQNIRQATTSLLDEPGVVINQEAVKQEAVKQDIPAVNKEQSETPDSDLPSLPVE